MKTTLLSAIIISLLLNSGNAFNAQNPKYDSLLQKSYEELDEFLVNKVDTAIGLQYATAYLLKAKNDNDSLRIRTAYFYLSRYHKLREALLYSDSMFVASKNLPGNNNYAASNYLTKGNIYYLAGEYKKALDLYLIGLECEKVYNDPVLYSIFHVNIGLLKNLMGDRGESLTVFRDYVKFLKKSKFEDKDFYLCVGLFNLGESYIFNNIYDSAAYILSEGLELSNKRNDIPMYANFLIYTGANLYYQGRYISGIDSILKGNKICTDKYILVFGYLFVGKSYLELRKIYKAIYYYSKVDSFLCETNNVTPELLEVYPVLIDFYARNKEMEKELYYTKNLLKFSAILEKNNQYLSKNIATKYDQPKLLASQEELIARLNKDKFLSKRNLILLGIGTFLLTILLIYYRWINNIYKRRFDVLMKKTNVTKNTSNLVTINLNKEKTNDIPDALVQKILVQLDKFEQSNKFTKKSYTLISLAKELNTNSTYLSKVINDKRGVNFATYLNDLRISFAINSLKTNIQLRSFTIEAISQEFGFNNAQSFSAAFHKRTGIYPSYFMKQLEA